MPETCRKDFSTMTGCRRHPPQRIPRKRRQGAFGGRFPMIGAVAGFSLILILALIAGGDVDAKSGMPTPLPQEEWLPPLIPEHSALPKVVRIRLKPGDTSISALQALGFDRAEAHSIVKQAESVHALSKVRAGHAFERIDSPSGIDVYYQIDEETRLHLHRSQANSEWRASLDKRRTIARQHIVSATIEDSLFAAAAKAGLDDRTTMNLVDIFAWDIDFARDIRQGDHFKVLYEERFDERGNQIGNVILAAEFVNQGKRFQAVRYEFSDGRVDYFTPSGRSMRKTYLKAPVKYTHISSRFQLHRKHPILGYTRAHRGVDYAAPAGTPVHAVGDGRIVFAGWKGGYGRLILIRHTNRNHSTAYAHLRAFAKGIRKGKYVHQGEVIGYVGMSGLATGPHLHFEFRVRGVAKNPLAIKRAPAKPIAASELPRFRQQTAPLLTKLREWRASPAWG